MMITPPVAAAQAGRTSGGGMLDTFKSVVSGATGGAAGGATSQAAPDAGPKGDGSVGLFDGVLKKAAFGGVAGAVMGFLPFIPGGPILGGIVGALGGAAMGVFGNWRKMAAIKAENQATVAAMGVQTDDPTVKGILQSGNVQQLLPVMQEGTQVQQGSATQTPVVQQGSAVTPAQQAQAVAQGKLPDPVDPNAKPQQSPVPTQATPGQVLVATGTGGGAIDPNAAVNPGVAPALANPSGGGGSAGDAGRPAAPVGTESSNVAAIAPTQAGIGAPASTTAAATGADLLKVDPATLDRPQLEALVAQLQAQIDQLKAILADLQKQDDAAKAAEAARAAQAAPVPTS